MGGVQKKKMCYITLAVATTSVQDYINLGGCEERGIPSWVSCKTVLVNR